MTSAGQQGEKFLETTCGNLTQNNTPGDIIEQWKITEPCIISLRSTIEPFMRPIATSTIIPIILPLCQQLCVYMYCPLTVTLQLSHDQCTQSVQYIQSELLISCSYDSKSASQPVTWPVYGGLTTTGNYTNVQIGCNNPLLEVLEY